MSRRLLTVASVCAAVACMTMITSEAEACGCRARRCCGGYGGWGRNYGSGYYGTGGYCGGGYYGGGYCGGGWGGGGYYGGSYYGGGYCGTGAWSNGGYYTYSTSSTGYRTIYTTSAPRTYGTTRYTTQSRLRIPTGYTPATNRYVAGTSLNY